MLAVSSPSASFLLRSPQRPRLGPRSPLSPPRGPEPGHDAPQGILMPQITGSAQMQDPFTFSCFSRVRPAAASPPFSSGAAHGGS